MCKKLLKIQLYYGSQLFRALAESWLNANTIDLFIQQGSRDYSLFRAVVQKPFFGLKSPIAVRQTEIILDYPDVMQRLSSTEMEYVTKNISKMDAHVGNKEKILRATRYGTFSDSHLLPAL